MKSSLWAAALFLAVSNVFALPAKFLAPDSTGRPQIQITSPGQYYLFRAADAYDGLCDSRWYTTVFDASNKSWCRTLAAYPQNAVISDTAPLDAVSENSPAEFEYMVGTSTDVNSATYIGWAPQVAVTDPDPIASWLQKINTQYGTDITRSAVLDTSSSLGSINSISVTYNSTVHNWFVYYNNKYVALFNENGALMGLTHRAYGMEFINPVNRISESSRAYSIFAPTAFGSSIVTPRIDPVSGNLILDWPNLYGKGFHITVTWNLKSTSDAVSSSGLNGKISVTTSGTKINYVAFPDIYGLSYGAGKKIVVPQLNSGKVYFSPSNTSTPASIELDYPSGDWQAQFFSIQNEGFSLYVAAEDSQQSPKQFNISPVSEGAAGYNNFYHYPQDGSSNVALNYQVVMAPMIGTWEKSAKKYQYWASKQKWNSDGVSALNPISSRPISQRVKQGAFWWTAFTDSTSDDRFRPTAFLNRANAQKNLIGPASGGNVRADFHLYRWWDSNFDINYPLFVPNQDSVAPALTWQQSIGDVQNDGSLVAPYLNASDTDVTNASTTDIPTYDNSNLRVPSSGVSHCSPDTSHGWWGKTFPFENGVNLTDSMLAKEVNTTTGVVVPYIACFDGDAILHAFMDPSSSTWQSIVKSNVNTVLGFGSAGVYLDVFAAANVNRSSYAKGYGSWYRDGLRQIGANTTQSATSNEQASPVFFGETGVRRFVAAEYFAEATIPYVDLVMNYENATPTDQPVIQNVYNQYQMMVGQKTALTHTDLVRKAIFGRSFVWGYQLGPVEIYLICPTNVCSTASSQDALNYIRTLEQARENLQEGTASFDWNSARFVGLADDADTANTVDFRYADDWCHTSDSAPTCPSTLPAVRGGLWSSSGTNAADYLVLTNTSNNAVTSSIPVPKAWSSANLVYQSTSGPDSYVMPFNNVISVYMPASSIAVYKATLSTVKANQYISVTAAAPVSVNKSASFSVAAISSSGLGVQIAVAGSCSYLNGKVTMSSTASTACTITYSQLGDSNYNAAASISSVTQFNQTISTGSVPTSKVYGSSFTVSPTATSSQAVSVSTSGGCSNSGNSITMISGTTACTINFDQAGNAVYASAPRVSKSVTATKKSQTITFNAQSPGSRTFVLNSTFAINPLATTAPSLSIAYSSTTSGVCAVSGTTVTMLAKGTCTIAANQSGDNNYSAATQKSRSVTLK